MDEKKSINAVDYKKDMDAMFPGISEVLTDERIQKIVDRLNACPSPGFGDIKHALRENAVVRNEPIDHILLEWFSAIIINTMLYGTETQINTDKKEPQITRISNGK